MGQSKEYPHILWDIGTAYDFFISLVILHDPGEYGLRPAWAAGMRQRIPRRDREVLETFQTQLLVSPPFQWIYSLPSPKDGATVLQTARDLPPLERVHALMGLSEEDPDVQVIIKNVISSGEWHQDDLDHVLSKYKERYGKSKNANKVKAKFDGWAKAEGMSDDVLRALQAYYDVFFADEERRILPALRESLTNAQELAKSQEFPETFEHISQGIRYSPKRFKGLDQVIMAPSFWATPFIFYTGTKPVIFLFGARPDDASLVPGEMIPDVLMASLNALSDPTRLRILRYLFSESLTPTQLATRLRLRAPTVAHHIKALRTAGLITVIPGAHKKEVHYQTRSERLDLACEMLKKFVSGQEG